MRPLSEHYPSWLSTIPFALLVALFALTLGGGFSATWLGPEQEFVDTGDYEADSARSTQAHEARESKATWLTLGCGAAGAGLAGWGWRAPRERRFHITYLSGLGVMVLDYIHIRLLQGHVAARGYLGDFSEHNRRFVFGDVMLPVVAAILALVVGVVLFLAALLHDRTR